MFFLLLPIYIFTLTSLEQLHNTHIVLEFGGYSLLTFFSDFSASILFLFPVFISLGII